MSILLTVSFILMDICGMCCFTALMRLLWEYPARSRKTVLITCIAALAASVITSVFAVANIPAVMYADAVDFAGEAYDTYSLYTGIQGLVSGCLLMFVPMILLRVKRFFRTFLVEVTVYFAAESLFSIVATVFDLQSDTPAKLLAEAVYGVVVYTALALFFRSGAKRQHPVPIRSVIDLMPRWLFAVLIVFSFTAYCKRALFDGGEDSAVVTRIYDGLWMLSTAGIILVVAYFMYRIFLLSFQQNQILRQMNDQQSNYEQMLKSDEQLREFRHDYKNHMMVVTALLNSGRTGEAADYLEKVKAVSGVAARQFSTGSFVADAILNNKNSLAEEYAIHISFSGRIPEKGIDNSDLCTVFANLLDNAIEGAKRFSGNRYIHIEANIRNGFLALSVENPVNEKATIKNNRIRTTKGDSKNHGIGLRNVERTAEKYGGQLLLSCTDTQFVADVSLKLDHSKEEENVQ
ncbi:MAG: sensor histidine kinase [Clostridia bacterium]|nr:sensor histidine kinase [Clostridia bacterium]